MDAEVYTILALGAIVGGFVNGMAGFGTALFALGFWLQVLPPVQAVPVVMILSVTSGIQGLWIVRHAIARNKTRLLRFLLPGLLGIPFGVAVLDVLDPRILKLAIAGFLVLYGGFFFLRRTLPKFERRFAAIETLVGFGGGFLGGAASLSGVLLTIWCSLRPWTKIETRAVMQPYNVTILALTIAVFAWRGVYSWEILKMVAFVLPIGMLSAQAGIFVFRRLSDYQFRRVLIGGMFVSGILLLARELV